MPCRHAGPNRQNDGSDSNSAVDRRQFMKVALAIGGIGAFATAGKIYGGPILSDSDPVSIEERQNRQHSWVKYLRHSEKTKTPILPNHHLLLFLQYEREDTPVASDRSTVETALRGLEREFNWNHTGLLFTIGYSIDYFDRFDEDLPAGIDLPEPDSAIEDMAAPNEDSDDIVADRSDAFLHLASDHAQNLLAAENALWGETDGQNSVTLEATFEDIFERPTSYPDRRTGFVGTDQDGVGLPQQEIEDFADDIPADSPNSMGFESEFQDSIPSEDSATLIEGQRLFDIKMPPGVFAQGTVAHISRLDIDLSTWYGNLDQAERRERMFSHHHDESAVGEVGEELGESSGPYDTPMRDIESDESDVAERTEQDAEDSGLVGHAQKLARARDDLDSNIIGEAGDGRLEPTLLRRDFNTTNAPNQDDVPGLNFLALMRFHGYMRYSRDAMNSVSFSSANRDIDHSTDEVDIEDHGILDFIDTKRRGDFLVPPLAIRALPPARSLDVDLTILPEDDSPSIDYDEDETVRISISHEEWSVANMIVTETTRFGAPKRVNIGGGVQPIDSEVDSDSSNDGLVLTFPLDDSGLRENQTQAKLFCKTENGLPVVGSINIATDK